MFPAKKRLKVCFIYIPLPIFFSSMNVPLLLRSWISNAPSEFFLMTNWSLLSRLRDFFGSWSSPMRTSLSVALPTRMNPTGLSVSIPLVNSTLRKSFCKEKSTPHWNRDKIESTTIVVLTKIEAKLYTRKNQIMGHSTTTWTEFCQLPLIVTTSAFVKRKAQRWDI